MALVGRIVRPHGNRGQVVVVPDTDFVETRFAPGAVVETTRDGARMSLTVTSCRVHDGRPIVGFAGFESINDAETLRGCELRVPETALSALEPGQYWRHDLVGCRVVVAGRDVGPVIRVDDGSTSLLVVDGGAGNEILVPMVAHICRRIDVAARVIEVAPMEGLLDLNAKSGSGRETDRGR